MTAYNEVKNLRKRLEELERVVKENASAPRASYTAIHDGGISEYDADGNLVSRTGTQHDGTHGAVNIFGPTPPVPTDPFLSGAPVSLTVGWDGHVIDELGGPRPLPLDFQCVQIFAWLDGDPVPSEPRGVITSEQGGEKSFTVPSGTWNVALRTRATTSQMSAFTATISVVVPNTVDIGEIEGQIANAQADAIAALAGADAAQIAADAAEATAVAAGAAAADAADDAAAAAGIAAGKGKVIIQSSAPAAGDQLAQNLWIDTTGGANTPKRWTGSTWTAVSDKVATDAATAAATAQLQADAAAAAAAAAAVSAGNALTAANGKNKINFGTSAPTAATPGIPGDVFWVRSGATIIGQYLNTAGTGVASGNTWDAQTLTNATIATLDAAKITTGTLNAGRIGAKSISTEKLLIGATDNLVDDPNFATLGTTDTVWGATSANIVADPVGGRAGGTSLKVVLNGTTQSVTSASQWKNTQPDAFYRISMWINPSVSMPAGGITSCIEQTVRETGALLTGATNSYVSTPDAAALDIVGDLDIRARAALTDWTPAATQTLVSKWTTTGSQRSYKLAVLLTTGRLRLSWSTAGVAEITADSTVSPVVADGAPLWVRAALDVDNGAAGRTVTFYTSEDGQTWTQLGTPVTVAGVTSVFAGTAPLAVGAHSVGASERLVGRVSTVDVRSGIDGTSVALPDFSVQIPGTTSFVDGTGLTWTLQAAASVGSISLVSEISAVTIEEAVPANVWTFISTGLLGSTGSSAVSIRPVVRVDASSGASGNIWFDQITVARAASGSLVVDGSIVTSKLAAESITGDVIAGGTITGDKFAGQILLGSKILTSEEGQRVEIDQAGVRLYNADDTVRVNLPAADGETASFQGEVQADSLTVTNGMTIYSTNNELSRSSAVTLAENLAGPVAAPTPTITWSGIALVRTAHSGTLGNFSLNPSEIIGVGRDFSSGGQRMLIMQERASGTRMWYYNMDGSIAAITPIDRVGYKVTGAYKTDALGLVWFAQKSSDGTWYFNRGGTYVRYFATDNYNVAMSSDATSYSAGWYVVEKLGSPVRAYRLREMSISGSEAVVVTNVVTPDNSPTPYSPALTFFWRGSADFGASRWVVGHQGTDPYRVFGSGGTIQADDGWNPPGAKVGAFWDAATGKFYSLCEDGILYAHSTLTWTGTTLNTWHVGQSFVDSNATGGTHETALGTLSSFTMKKRAEVKFTMVDVPFAGGVDDPNGWNLYVKRGTAPASNYSDLYLQTTGAYTVKTTSMTAAPVTSGTTALQVGTFPGSVPAIFRSGRALPSDSTKPIIELKGDGSGRFGTLEVSNTGVVTDTTDTGWVSIPDTIANVTGTLFGRRIGNRIWLRGGFARTSGNWGATNNTSVVVNNLPANFTPTTSVNFTCPSDAAVGTPSFRFDVLSNNQLRLTCSEASYISGASVAVHYLAD